MKTCGNCSRYDEWKGRCRDLAEDDDHFFDFRKEGCVWHNWNYQLPVEELRNYYAEQELSRLQRGFDNINRMFINSQVHLDKPYYYWQKTS